MTLLAVGFVVHSNFSLGLTCMLTPRLRVAPGVISTGLIYITFRCYLWLWDVQACRSNFGRQCCEVFSM